MKKLKTRLALLLCILLTVPTIINALPMNTLKAEAADGFVSLNWSGVPMDYSQSPFLANFTIEVGKTVELGDRVYFLERLADGNYTNAYLSTVSKETYKVDKSSVASVSSAGKLTAKNTGKAVVTITYKNATTKCEVTVVKRNSLGASKSKYANLKKKLDAVIKAYNGGITSKNRYAVSEALDEYNVVRNSFEGINYYGFLREKQKTDWGYNYSDTSKWVFPEMVQIQKINSEMYEVARNLNPIGTVSSKWFKIKSISAKRNSDTMTINLKKSVTKAQVFAIQYMYSNDDYRVSGKRATFRVIVKDTKTGYRYYGWAVAKVGSKKITLNMDYLDFKKGRTYQLIAYDKLDTQPYGWTGGKKIKIK